MKKKLRFSVIIANYNGIKYINDCLSSVVKTNYKNYEIILIEDGSSDGSLKIIKKFQKEYGLRVFQNEQNLGLVASRNRAIKKAKGEILVFLDNDTQVDKNWLKGLEEVFRDQTVGAAQCKIFDYHKRKIIQEVGMKLVPFTGFGTPLGRGQTDHGQYDSLQNIISLGAALAVREEVAKMIGGFDNRLFHYTDDLDFSWRVWIAGYRVCLAPKAVVYHYTKTHPANFHLYFHLSKNSLRMIIKNYEITNVIKYLPFPLIFNIIGGFSVLFKKRNSSAIIGVLLGLSWSLFFLPDTLKERSKVQGLRRVKDKNVFNKIMISTNILDIFKIYFGIGKNKKITVS